MSLLKEFLKNEDGSQAVEMALLFPVILGVILFALYINMFYEGKIATSIGANEALRYAMTQTSLDKAKSIASERLIEVYQQHNIKQTSKMELTHVDTNSDGKYSIGDTLILKVYTKKGQWCHYTYELRARVEDDALTRGD